MVEAMAASEWGLRCLRGDRRLIVAARDFDRTAAYWRDIGLVDEIDFMVVVLVA